MCQPNCNIFATFPVSLISDTCTSMMLCSSSTYSLSVSINSFIMWLLRKGKRKTLSELWCVETLWRVCVHHVINCSIQICFISCFSWRRAISRVRLSQIFSVFNNITLTLGFRHLNTQFVNYTLMSMQTAIMILANIIWYMFYWYHIQIV